MPGSRRSCLALTAISLSVIASAVIASAVTASTSTAALPAASAATRSVALTAYTEPAALASTSDQRRARFKKGVGAWAFPKSRRALAKSGASWYYTWAVNHPGITTAKGVKFVPMIWGAKDVTARQLSLAERQGHILLTFNEPDLSAQSNMTVAQALRLWPKLMATKMRLGSPAVAFGAANPNFWLDEFMRGAARRHYRVNFITLHWYGGDFATKPAVSELKSYIQSVWQRYHKPIWLTEFALWRFDPSVFPSPRQQAAFLTAATAMLRKLPYVWRYAWFALPADGADGTAGLFRPGAVPTAAGRAFEKVP
jgi:Glycosyl hydrolase catalytic core